MKTYHTTTALVVSNLGELSKSVRVVVGVYDLDTGKVEWVPE